MFARTHIIIDICEHASMSTYTVISMHVCVCVMELILGNSLSLSLVVDEWLGGQKLVEKLQGPEALQCVYHSN